ncbi:hypothetical protein MBLNU459_g7236t2 [Dothideomycetes sp. NU459]
MVKPDIKRNYYADLELPHECSLEDIKKQYRKLALKYHPDRNPGKEAECNPKFQAIQAAHEILEDPVTRAKYDSDRRKAGLLPAFKQPTQYPPGRGNPYTQAPSNFPPPPRRTATTGTWRTTTAGATGADRFANFQKAAPTSKRESMPDPSERLNGWYSMHPGKTPAGGAQTGATPNRGRTSPQRPGQTRPAPPPRADTRMPTEEDIRAGMNYRAAPAGGFSSDRARSAFAEFNAMHAGKSGVPPQAPKPPGVSRSNTTRTPKKSGFDPMSGADEGQAASTANYSSFRSRTRSDDARVYPPPPPRPHPFAQAPEPDHLSSSRAEDVPYTEANRTRTPYSAHIGQQTYASSDNLRRTQSTVDAAGLHNQTNPSNAGRHRSSSPSRPPAQPKARRPFVVYSSSEDSDTSSESDEGSSARKPNHTQPKASAVDDQADNPFLRNFQRPKKMPTPPSRQFTKNGSPVPNVSDATFDSNKANAGRDHESSNVDVPKNGKPSMYAQSSPSFLFSHRPSATPSKPANISRSPSPMETSPTRWSNVFPFGPKIPQTKDAKRKIPQWAIPSSVHPASKTKPKPIYGWSMHGKFAKACRTAQPASATGQQTSSTSFKRSKKQHTPEYDTHQNLSPRAPSYGKDAIPTLSSPGGVKIDPDFSFPINPDTFASTTNQKSRSEENINVRFTPAEWAGTFTSNNVFAAPPPPATRKPTSPVRKGSKVQRPQTNVGADSAHVPKDGFTGNEEPQWAPPPPTSADRSGGEPKSIPGSPPNQPVKFSADEWAKTLKDPSWTYVSGQGRPTPPTSRPTSRGGSTVRKAGKAGVKFPTTPKSANVTSVEEEEAATAGIVPEEASAAPVDEMDIDTATPPTATVPPPPPLFNAEKEPRMYKVDLSQTHQTNGSAPLSQSKDTGHAHRDRESSGFQAKLDDLGNALHGSSASGLEGLNDMSSTLPFPSQASSTNPLNTFTPRNLPLPNLPRAPDTPTRLSKISWQVYCQAMSVYLAKFQTFNATILSHFSTRHSNSDALITSGVRALEAVGQSTLSQGFPAYVQGVKEDERVREHWNLGCEKHREAVERFEKPAFGDGFADLGDVSSNEKTNDGVIADESTNADKESGSTLCLD